MIFTKQKVTSVGFQPICIYTQFTLPYAHLWSVKLILGCTQLKYKIPEIGTNSFGFIFDFIQFLQYSLSNLSEYDQPAEITNLR